MNNLLKISLLAENRDGKQCKGEFGLSILVEINNNKFLFDVGVSDLFTQNAEKLGIDLDSVETVAISHGHLDHVGGLPYLSEGKCIIAHPDIFKKYFSLKDQKFKHIPIPQNELTKSHNLILTKDPYEIFEDIYFIGEIPRVVPFEGQGNIAGTLDSEGKVPDLRKDDTGIAIKTSQGLFVLTGCGHSGICNIIEQAKKVTGEDRIYAVLGGFHFMLPQLDKTEFSELDGVIGGAIDYFKKNKVQHAYLGHCVEDEVIDRFERELKGITSIYRLFSGAEFELTIQ